MRTFTGEYRKKKIIESDEKGMFPKISKLSKNRCTHSSGQCKCGWQDPPATVWGEMGREVENISESVFNSVLWHVLGKEITVDFYLTPVQERCC